MVDFVKKTEVWRFPPTHGKRFRATVTDLGTIWWMYTDAWTSPPRNSSGPLTLSRFQNWITSRNWIDSRNPTGTRLRWYYNYNYLIGCLHSWFLSSVRDTCNQSRFRTVKWLTIEPLKTLSHQLVIKGVSKEVCNCDKTLWAVSSVLMRNQSPHGVSE
jgi:hypothetical protein